jgi:hypothetical protein
MELINQWNIQNTIIELDAKTIVDAVHSSKNPRTNWGSITSHCANWLEENRSISVVWTRRNGNKAAHALARWAGVEPNGMEVQLAFLYFTTYPKQYVQCNFL